MRSSSGAARWTLPAALAAVCLLALALRLTGIDRELPHLREPDAYVVDHLQLFRGDRSLAQHQNFEERYPSLLARAFALLPYPEVPARATGPGCERAHLARASWPFHLIRVGMAIVSTAYVLLTWLLARRFLSPGGALLAAFFVATSLISILFAQQGRPHAAQAFFALLTVLLSLRVRERATVPRIAIAAIAAALAAATLQNGIFALLPLAMAIFLGRREGRVGGLRRLLVPLLVAGIVAIAAFAAAAPFYPRLPYVDEQGIHLAPEKGGGHIVLFSLVSLRGFWLAARLLWMHDPILATLGLAGAILGIDRLLRGRRAMPRGDKLDLAVLASYALPYFAVVGINAEIYERFLLPLLPYVACLAALAWLWVVAQLRERVRDAWLQASAGFLVGAVFLGFPTLVALRYARAAAADDTLEQAAAWIRSNVEPGSSILITPGTDLPLLYEPETLRTDLQDPAGQSLPWLCYQGLLPPDDPGVPRYKLRLFPAAMAAPSFGLDPERMEIYVRESGAGYVVFEFSRKMRNLPIIRSLHHAAVKLGDRVFRSHGQAQSLAGLGPIDYQNVEDMAQRLLAMDAFGPGVVIYKIRR